MSLRPAWMKRYPLLARFWFYRLVRANGVGIGTLAIQWAATSFPQPALALAYTNTLGRATQVFTGYLAGWLSDHVPPIRLIVWSNLLAAVFTGAIAMVLRAPYRLVWLIAAVIVWNAFAVISRAASPAIVPKISRREDLPAVNAWMSAVGPAQQFLASGMGGILLAAGLFHTFLASGLATALSTIFLLTKKAWPLPSPRHRPLRSLTLGLSYTWSHRVLRRMVLFSSVLNFGFSFYIGEYLLYMRQTLHLGPAALGLALTASTAGTVFSLIFIPRWLPRHLLAIAAAAPALMAIGLAILSLWQSWAGFVLGAAVIELGSGAVTQGLVLVRQSVVPTDVMGSVSGALSMFHMVLVPAGMALAGVVAFTYGPAAAMICAAALVASASLLALPYARLAASSLACGSLRP